MLPFDSLGKKDFPFIVLVVFSTEMTFFSCNTLQQILQRNFLTILPWLMPSNSGPQFHNISLISRRLTALIFYQISSKVYYSEGQSYQLCSNVKKLAITPLLVFLSSYYHLYCDIATKQDSCKAGLDKATNLPSPFPPLFWNLSYMNLFRCFRKKD